MATKDKEMKKQGPDSPESIALSAKGSLGLLALGYEGIEEWRKLRKEQGVNPSQFLEVRVIDKKEKKEKPSEK